MERGIQARTPEGKGNIRLDEEKSGNLIVILTRVRSIGTETDEDAIAKKSEVVP